MAIFAEYRDTITARDPPGPQCLNRSRYLCGKLTGGNRNPRCIVPPQYATRLVPAGYREENIIEVLNVHGFKW